MCWSQISRMLFQSHDGSVLIQTTTVLIHHEKEQNIYYLYACNNNGEFDVGIFDTEFEAQTVLKDVQKHLENSEANSIYQVPYRIQKRGTNMSKDKQFQDVTSDFENMIQSFAADFELAVNSKNKIAIASKNPRLLHDIEKLSELAFYLRTKQVKFIKETNQKESKRDEESFTFLFSKATGKRLYKRYIWCIIYT